MTKIEFGFNKISRIDDLADLAALFFPHNKRHQKVFLAIFIELKYADNQFLPNLNYTCDKYSISRRLLEIVRSKMRRLGLIDHVSRFNSKYGYREGWIFSTRFSKSISNFDKSIGLFKAKTDSKQEIKDRDSFKYL